jgi:hypothetical protein
MESIINKIVLGADQKELVLREGKAVEIKEPLKVAINGVLDSPLKWLKKRICANNFMIISQFAQESEVLMTHSHIIVDRDAMSIKLVIGENDHYQTTVTGKLEFHPAFLKFGINNGVYITSFEMADLIKMNRTFFENKDVAMALVSTLKNFKARVDKQIEASDDNRGNKMALLNQVVDSNLPAGFKMVLPIFKGQAKETIEVEVYIRASDLTCTLISPQANEIQEQLRDEEMSKVIKAIEELVDIVIIEK